MPLSYRAVGSFHYKTLQKSFRGMWDLLCKDQDHYRLAIYSSLGTLEGCLAFNQGHFTSCGGSQVSPDRIFQFLPPSLLARLPQLLLGHVPGGKVTKDPQGRTTQAILPITGSTWVVTYSHYLAADGVPYPTLVVIQGGGKETLKIRIEEMKPGWTPSSG